MGDATDEDVGMTPPLPPLRTAVVVEPGADSCVVVSSHDRRTVGYAAPFGSRAAELRPGQLVALAAGEPELVVWRWFDAVVLAIGDGQVRLWKPAHGEVSAQPRRPDREPRPGTRAYLSAGLPGAEWWVAGPVDAAPEDADVERDEVVAFYEAHGLWDRLSP
jgi:hypothetical protein